MNVTLKNIGTIEEASFNLDKDLIVFIGPNNTGKTYAAYCLYGLDKINLKREVFDSLFDIDINTLIEKGSLDVNLEEIFTEKNIQAVFEKYQSFYKDFLPQLFGIDQSYFENSSVSLSFVDIETFRNHLKTYRFLLGSSGYGDNIVITFNKKNNVPILNLTLKRNNIKGDKQEEFPKERILTDIKNSIVEYTFKPYKSIFGAYFLPSERIGISVFSKDVFTKRFTKTNEILALDNTNKKEFLDLIKSEFNTYSLVIQDSLRNYEAFTKGRKIHHPEHEKTSKLADEIEEKLLKGTISVNKEGDVYFNINQKNIKIQATGSIIKSLAGLVLYLRYSSFPGQILIIDEPEINLHPDNQRLIARMLAKLSKLGIKVIISTHSDYFIRELNNLMMLNKKHEQTQELREKYGYDESEVLNYKNVGAYLFKRDHKVVPLNVTEAGMEAATIDEEINKLNNTANDLYWTLFEN